jgi:hypothetical protein
MRANLFFLLAGALSLLLTQPAPCQNKEKPKIDRRLRDTSARYIFPLDNLPRRHTTGLNILGLFAQNAHAFYEWRALPILGLRQQVMIGRFREPSSDPEIPFKVRAFVVGGGTELAIYPFRKAPRGSYLAAGGTYRWYNAEILLPNTSPATGFFTGRKKLHLLSASVVAGWQFIAGNWFVMNPFLGAAWNFSLLHAAEGSDQEAVRQARIAGTGPVSFRFGLILGLAFK